MRNAIAAVMVVLSFGCASQPPLAVPADETAPAAPLAESSPDVTSSPRAPMTVEWVLQGEAFGRLTLVARVNRNTPMMDETTVNVMVPAGVRVVSGRTSWVISASESRGPVDELIVFEVAQPGAGEILLTADAVGANFGVHAKKAWKLGSPAAAKSPKPSAPVPSLEVGGHDFGPSVPARP